MIAELLSGSSPPAEFFNPFGLILMTLLYGCGALLVREAKVRWNLGWVAIGFLGAAYGILEEGLCCKSFFDPNWPDLGDTAYYVRVGPFEGVALCWAVFLTWYHAFISISVPILLSELVFPDQKNSTVLSHKGIAWSIIGLTIATLTGFFLFPSPENVFHPSWLYIILSAGIIAFLILYAKKLGYYTGPILKLPAWRNNLHPGFLGFIVTTVSFIAFYTLANVIRIELLSMAIILGIIVVSTMLITGRFLRPGKQPEQMEIFNLIFGAMMFFIIFTFLQESENQGSPDGSQGMIVVGLIALALMLWLRSRLIRKGKAVKSGLKEIPESI